MGTGDDLPQPGELFAGKYAIARIIGEGGMGIVFEARHRRLDKRVAIKLLHGPARERPDVVARFEREARAAVQLRGRNVARVYDVDALPDGSPYMVMEYLDGRDLSVEMAERGAFAAEEAIAYVLQACAAMSEAHELGIVHRDLKPGNLFLTEYAGARLVKVLDFGISKVKSDENQSVTTTQSTLGTPLYMSPEQVRSAKHVDARSDIWSLGVILYEMLAGEPPFVGDSASAIIAAIAADEPKQLVAYRPDLPELSPILMRALEKQPADRYQSVDEFAQAIAPFGSSGETEPRALSDRPRPSHADLQVQARALVPTLPADAIRAPRPSKPGIDAGADPGARASIPEPASAAPSARDAVAASAPDAARTAEASPDGDDDHRPPASPTPVAWPSSRSTRRSFLWTALAIGGAAAAIAIAMLAFRGQPDAASTAADSNVAPTPAIGAPTPPQPTADATHSAAPIAPPDTAPPVATAEPSAAVPALPANAVAPKRAGARSGHAPKSSTATPSPPPPQPTPIQNPVHL